MPNFKSLRLMLDTQQLVVEVYRVTRTFPAEERFGLSSQMRRAVISIGANVAEGAGRGGDREFAHFLRIARGSAHELEFEVMAAHDLGMMNRETANDLRERLADQSRMLSGLIRKLCA
ncbi:MAG TPA: four helix bundle protein [Gemmatimonadales bacterium]|jgi:four helix bundle protein|nr:four helix bundle protein [Gemmatimonadales bacterium]